MSDQPPAAAPVVDTHALMVTYSNYFRASGSAEELILDFGLDPQRHNPNDVEGKREGKRGRGTEKKGKGAGLVATVATT